jgi:hypothetical protein
MTVPAGHVVAVDVSAGFGHGHGRRNNTYISDFVKSDRSSRGLLISESMSACQYIVEWFT